MTNELQELVSRVIDGRYRLEQMIAFGGMGAVFRATQLPLGYDVALKVLHPHLAADDASYKRFEREAYSASKLDHPNCVKVFDYGHTLDGITYMAMELLQGAELKSMLGAPMAPGVAAARMIQLLEGLGHAHERGIIHRDLKPANIFATYDSQGREVLKIVDFGIARVLEDLNNQEKLTLTGIVYGTPHYMSPEQATGGTADARSDIYAAGLIFYRMLAGRPPFRAEGAAELMRMQIMQPPDLLPHETPRILAHIVQRMLEKDPARRYASAREIVERLEQMRPLLANVPPAPAGPPPPMPLPGPSPAQSMMPPVLRSSSDGDTAPLGAGSWNEAAAASLSGRDAMRSAHGARRPTSVLPWLLAAVALGVAAAAVGMLLWFRHGYESDMAQLRARMDESPGAAGTAETGGEAAGEELAVAMAVDPAAAAAGTPAGEAGDAAEAGETGDAEQIELTIRTNVDADILDAGDYGIFGRTNAAQPVLVERSDRPLALVLRADGYVDHPVSITPDEHRSLTVELVRAPAGPSGRPRTARKGGGHKSATQTPATEVQKPAKKPESIDGAKLRDPFGG